MSQPVPSTLLGPPPFVDREDQLGRISRHIADLRGDPRYFKVIEVLGLGGMGKTSLLEELWTRVLEMGQGDHLVWIALEGEASTSSTGPLLSMRDQIDCLCLLFDTAILAYWSAMGQPLQLGRSGRLADSLAVKALELGSGLAGFALPVGFGIRVFDSLRGARRKRLHYTPEEFEEIERLHKRPGELLERLPYYLGVDLRRSIDESGGSFVAFYDAYDRQAILTRHAKAPWIREFIGTLELGVHAISSREPLDWDERRWGDLLEAIPINALPGDHARALLSASVGQLDRDTEDRLIGAARRVPFLLSTVISGYAELTRRGEEISLEKLPASPDSAVAHFLEHLPDAQRDLAIALAAVQVFDERLFRCVVVELNIQVSFPSFHEFVDWYFVESISGDIYKTHDLLTAFVRESPGAENVRVAALEAATRSLFERCGIGSGAVNPDDVLPILRAVVVGWYSAGSVGTSSMETLVDVGFSLYDAGYWNELASLGSEGSLGGGHPIDVLLEFFRALTARRILGVEAALERFAALLPRVGLLGRRELGVDLEATYVIGLAGDYRAARKGFRRVVDSFSRLDPSDRTQVRARMYQGGMLLMDGEFQRSSALLAETYDAIDPDESSDWGELIRFRGHAHRFSFALGQAEELYLRALRTLGEDRIPPALLGRLYTNLTETYCWSDPNRAVETVDRAVGIHASLGNQIELAKCDAALGIALSKLGDDERARAVIAKSLRRAEEVGYLGGVSFALQASVVAEWLAADFDAATVACRQLVAAVEDMDTYRHLQAVPFLLLGDDARFARVVAEAEWLDGESVEKRIGAYMRSS